MLFFLITSQCACKIDLIGYLVISKSPVVTTISQDTETDNGYGSIVLIPTTFLINNENIKVSNYLKQRIHINRKFQ